MNYKILICPDCSSKLAESDNWLLCSNCGTKYKIRNGIPILLPANHLENKFEMNYHEHYNVDGNYYDYFKERQEKVSAHDENRLRDYVLSLVPKNVKSILDIGSGGAWVAKSFMKKNVEVCSFDLTYRNVEKAIKTYTYDSHYGIVGDALNPPFEKNSFDCIIASEVIEHTVEPAVFIQKLIPLLKPGGVLIISTPYKEIIQYSICIHCNQPTPRNSHLHSFDEKILGELVMDDGIIFKYRAFGNKALVILRTYVILQFLPFSLWKIIDSIANIFINRRYHIVCTYSLKNDSENKK